MPTGQSQCRLDNVVLSNATQSVIISKLSITINHYYVLYELYHMYYSQAIHLLTKLLVTMMAEKRHTFVLLIQWHAPTGVLPRP